MAVITKPYLFPDLLFYRRITQCRGVKFDWGAPFDKRHKDARRYTIADVNGKLSLTVPIMKPESLSRTQWGEIRISPHGDWQAVHLTALESAYGRTPFFEFYVDSFKTLFSKDWNGKLLKDYVEESHRILCSHLSVLPPLSREDTTTLEPDYMKEENLPCGWNEYWQPRADRLGFIYGLSILDALFCIGPETELLIKDMAS